jgi:hypothetical protein
METQKDVNQKPAGRAGPRRINNIKINFAELGRDGVV